MLISSRRTEPPRYCWLVFIAGDQEKRAYAFSLGIGRDIIVTGHQLAAECLEHAAAVDALQLPHEYDVVILCHSNLDMPWEAEYESDKVFRKIVEDRNLMLDLRYIEPRFNPAVHLLERLEVDLDAQ